MKLRQFIISLFWLFSANFSIAQIQVELFKFRTNTGDSYVDVIVDFPGNICKFNGSKKGIQSNTTITVIAESQGEVSQFQKTNLQSPIFSDSIEAIKTNQIHLERLALNPGNYNVIVKIEGKKVYSVTKSLRIDIGGFPEVSSLLLVEAYAASSSTDSKFYRSGYEILPLTSNIISPQANQLRFYTELYNIDDVVGSDSLFLLVFGLTNSSGQLDPNHTKYKRLNAKDVVPVFEVLPISALTPPSSDGELQIQVKTRDGHLICKKIIIERWKPEANGFNDSVNFASAWTDRDLLYRHLEDHLPLASPSQQNTIGGVLKNTNEITVLQSFLEQFWIKRNPGNPENAWRNYFGEIMVVDSLFGGCRGGHGADTDMGYVYLKYGRPNTVVKRHHNTNYYPYEIWHYHHTNGFTNRRFLFFAPHVVLECMEILQSDMPGEINNEDWIQLLRSRENRVNVIDSQMNRLNPRDTYSREEPEDLYYNPR